MARPNVHEQDLLERAKEIAAGYRVMIEPARSGGFMGRVLELPKVLARAETQEQCLLQLRENVIHVVATILDMGRVPPRPAEKRLTEQFNIRLTPEEKQRAEALAQQQGFRGLGDYVRGLLAKQTRD
jgi:predicted RNase H-like HicB family nuclease